MKMVRNLALVVVLLSVAGCGEVSQITGSTFHQKFGWKAEDYFTDPKVIALCHAIEANDLAKIDRQIAAGADVNANGKDGMTPLLWAFADNKLERFSKLLEHGADPNVFIQSDLNTHGGFHPGDTVTHMACGTEFPGNGGARRTFDRERRGFESYEWGLGDASNGSRQLRAIWHRPHNSKSGRRLQDLRAKEQYETNPYCRR